MSQNNSGIATATEDTIQLQNKLRVSLKKVLGTDN